MEPVGGWKGSLDYFEAGDVVAARNAINAAYEQALAVENEQFEITALTLTTAQQAVSGARATRTRGWIDFATDAIDVFENLDPDVRLTYEERLVAAATATEDGEDTV